MSDPKEQQEEPILIGLPSDETAASAEGIVTVSANGAAEAAPPPDPLAEFQRRIDALAAELDAERDKRLRALAEWDNYRKRTQGEYQRIIAQAGERIIRGLLPLLDDLQRSVESQPEIADAGAIKRGVEIAARKLENLLAAEGVTPIEALGKPFDPDYHEAMSSGADPEQPDGIVITEVQRGYRLGDRVLRHSRVIVNKLERASDTK